MTNVKRCCGCGEYKVASEFHVNSRSPDGLFSSCKSCVAEHDITKRQIKSDYANQIRENGECIVCGKKGCLIFHHEDAANKETEVSKLIHRNGRTLSELKEEIVKCILVCVKPCHGVLHGHRVRE